MGKTGKAAKRRKLAQAEADSAAYATTHTPDSEETNDPAFLSGLLAPGEVAVAVRALNTLSTHEDVLKANKSEALVKALRGAVFDFQRVSATVFVEGSTLTSRISSALSSARNTDALVLLAEMRLRKLTPKLGALQRWVRDCDAASRSDGSFGDSEVLRVLDGILRCTSARDIEFPAPGPGAGPVRKMSDWRMRDLSGVGIWKEIESGVFPAAADKDALTSSFRLIHNTPGPERLPPNHHPALLYASASSTIPLNSTTPVTRHYVPSVPNTFLLADVLSLDECRSILAHAEAVGFAPDQPVAEDGKSVLAHNLYWLADLEFERRVWERVVGLLPQEIGGGKVTGLNRRFRVYRYVPGAIYRPHIDGAWPASGTDPVTGEYLYDSSPSTEPQWSRLTFLIYLNDDFDNGATTFFLPSTQEGVLNAYPVKPLAGCALVFPHGDTSSALHEGSPVGAGGAKYVIRTEVLYRVEKAVELVEV